jgi:hypothetical protein
MYEKGFNHSTSGIFALRAVSDRLHRALQEGGYEVYSPLAEPMLQALTALSARCQYQLYSNASLQVKDGFVEYREPGLYVSWFRRGENDWIFVLQHYLENGDCDPSFSPPVLDGWQLTSR